MHVYRNKRYEEEIVMLMWHMEGEQRMIETSKQKTQKQAHHTITESATQTYTQKQTKDYVHGIWYRGQNDQKSRLRKIKPPTHRTHTTRPDRHKEQKDFVRNHKKNTTGLVPGAPRQIGAIWAIWGQRHRSLGSAQALSALGLGIRIFSGTITEQAIDRMLWHLRHQGSKEVHKRCRRKNRLAKLVERKIASGTRLNSGRDLLYCSSWRKRGAFPIHLN